MQFLMSLDLPREAESVPLARRLLDGALAQLGLGEAERDDLTLALTEACSNVLRHAQVGAQYSVVGRLDDSRCVIEVRDDGAGFASDRTEAERDAADAGAGTLAESGRGLQIMQALMDEVHWHTGGDGSGTTVHLTKSLSASVNDALPPRRD